MCLVHGLADGRYLTDNSLLPEELATDAGCSCHGDGVSRRGLLKAGGALAAASALGGLLPKAAAAQSPAPPPTGDAIVPLGVGGGPVLTAAHSQPALALVVNGTTYLVDAGADVMQQMVKAKLPFNRLAHLFVTHHHSDHVAGYPPLAILGWLQVPTYQRLDVWGPPPVKRMHRALFDLFAVDIPSREYSGLTPLDKVLFAHEVRLGRSAIRRVFEDNNVRVSAVRVSHGAEIKNAYAYRFDVKRTGASVVFSGDTAPTDNLVRLAQGADVLVHEVMSMTGVEIIVKVVDPKIAPSLRQHLIESHTTTEQLPAVAKRAGVKRVVLSHYTPNVPPIEAIAADVRAQAAKAGYGGEILTGTELVAVPLQA